MDAYQQVFAHYADWPWAKVVKQAGRHARAIEEFAPSAIEEMRGIADGAGVTFGDVLALNVRSEVMFASAAQGRGRLPVVLANECSSFAVLPEASRSGHTLIGQNWDWLLHARDTVLMLDVRRDDGPDYVTIVEAGLLAKTGVNAAGVATCTNTLVSLLNDQAAGVPYHVVLRKLLDAESISDGVSTVINADKALSANYLLGHTDGLAIDLEVVPGGATSVRVLMPERGLLAHTNHYLTPEFVKSANWVATNPGTFFRLYCLQSTLEREAPDITVEGLQNALCDHRNFPQGVCAHGNERLNVHERYATIASVIYDLDAHEIYVSAGVPCTGSQRRYRFEPPRGLAEEMPANRHVTSA
jgi:isopenicillin-N N-acyltransferase-like protein